MKVYMKIKRDEYELPLAVADSINELARLVKTDPAYICHVCKRTEGVRSYVAVEIEDEEKEQQVRGADSLLIGDTNTTKGGLLR